MKQNTAKLMSSLKVQSRMESSETMPNENSTNQIERRASVQAAPLNEKKIAAPSGNINLMSHEV
jgi:hypothetical protein